MTEQVVARVIEMQFPELAPVRASFLNEGCDSAAFVINDSWIFRFPKRDEVEHQLLIETRVLSVLEERAPVAVPAFRFHGQASGDFPFRFVGYARIGGIPGIQIAPDRLAYAAIAPRLAHFLTWLHAIPPEVPGRLGVPEYGIHQLVEESRAEALDDLDIVAGVAPAAPLDEWRSFLAATPDLVVMKGEPPSLVHNDFAAEHVLVDPGTGGITGVVDWSDVAIGHPVADFAGVFHWGGEDLMAAVLHSYAGLVDAAFIACARYLGACRGVGDVRFGVEQHRKEYFDTGLRALTLCVPSPRLHSRAAGGPR